MSYIKDWDKGIKFAADSGLLDQIIFMITGSDMTTLEEARASLEGVAKELYKNFAQPKFKVFGRSQNVKA